MSCCVSKKCNDNVKRRYGELKEGGKKNGVGSPATNLLVYLSS